MSKPYQTGFAYSLYLKINEWLAWGCLGKVVVSSYITTINLSLFLFYFIFIN
jgi:hypothetical protein